MINIKKRIVLIIAIVMISITLLTTLIACVEPLPDPPPEIILPEVEQKEQVTVSGVKVGESLADVRIVGNFKEEGTISFITPDKTFTAIGITSHTWQVVPTDLEEYSVTKGTIDVEAFNHKITLEECGGFEINDVYFNTTYTLDMKPLTAKNEYRFDGWSIDDGSKDYIARGDVVNEDTTWYASYTAVTNQDKLRFMEDKDHEGNIYKVKASLNDKNFSGEIIIPDMYKGVIVTIVSGFEDSKITKIVFGSFVEIIGGFERSNGLTEVFIPNTVEQITGGFERSANLSKVVFEDGNEPLRVTMNAFMDCPIETLELNRLKAIGTQVFAQTIFHGNSKLTSVFIPKEVVGIAPHAFLNNTTLEEVIFEEGSKLNYIGMSAFGANHALTDINIPNEDAFIHPQAFDFSGLVTSNISKSQLQGMAEHLYMTYANTEYGSTEDIFNIEINIDKNAVNPQGNYNLATNTLKLTYDGNVDNMVINVLSHEFYHYLQAVCIGQVPDKTKERVFEVLSRVNQFVNTEIEITEDMIVSWSVPYIPPTTENFDDYWNQAFEADARAFGTLISGIYVEKPTNPII